MGCRLGIGVALLALIAGCGGVDLRSDVTLPGEGGRISVLFNEFPDGAACQVDTPEGVLRADLLPGKIDYPGVYRNAPVMCIFRSGETFAVNIEDQLPLMFNVAGITVLADGRLFATIDTGSDLVRVQATDVLSQTN